MSAQDSKAASSKKGFTLINRRTINVRPAGFTLIELMVVIAIIAVLAAVGSAVYSTTQKNGRTSKRIQDLKTFKTAMETYKATNGKYPVTGDGSTIVYANLCNNSLATANALIPSTPVTFVPNYMPAIPTDPLFDISQASRNYCWQYASNGTDYKLFLVINSGEMSATTINSQPELIDQLTNISGVNQDGLCTGTHYNNRVWAVYSGGTSGGSSSRCW